MDDRVALLLEYLATRKCHRRSLAVNEKGDNAMTKSTSTSRAYRESLVKVLKNAGHGKDFVDVHTAEDEDGDSCPLAWLQTILETLVFDSYQASCSNEPNTESAKKVGGGAYLDDRHVVVAVQALGMQCTSRESGAIKAKLTMSELRVWRALLERHVARRVVAAPDGRTILPWRRSRGQVRVTATAISLFHRIVASLLEPSHVKLWTATDGVQISFRSSCGMFKANYFHFLDSNDDHHKDMPELDEDSGEWIGAVIGCSAAKAKEDLAHANIDEDSSLGSDPCCDDDDDDEEVSLSDEEDEEEAGFSKGASESEMSTASMSSSLSATSSEESTEATGPATPLLLAGKNHRRRYGDGYGNCGPTKEEPATRRIRLTLQAVLLASVLFRS